MLTLLPVISRAQDRKNCPTMFRAPHLITDCLEALFSQDPVHLTAAGVPGNGLSLGIEAHAQHHYASPFESTAPAFFNDNPALREGPVELVHGRLSALDAKLEALVSMNGSWIVSGSTSWMPAAYIPGHRKDIYGIQHPCNRLGPFCTRTVMAVHFEGTHQQMNTLSIYGIGPLSPALKHTYPEDETWGRAEIHMPFFDWLTGIGGVQGLKAVQQSSSDLLAVPNTFTEATAPGLHSQHTYLHSHGGFSSRVLFDWNPTTAEPDDNRTGPLMKKNLLFTLSHTVEFHDYDALDQPAASFHQFVYNGDESIQLGANILKLIYGADADTSLKRFGYGLLRHLCSEDTSLEGRKGSLLRKMDPSKKVWLKVNDPCNFGRLDLRTSLTISEPNNGATIPYYMRPTVGGSDINSQQSLRGFPDYRFRDNDAVFDQVEYTIPVHDPIGLLLFYDSGTVGPALNTLSFAHLRQDSGIGATFRIHNAEIGQVFMAWGAGHGPYLHYAVSHSF